MFAVRAVQVSQSSSARPSSIETIGYFAVHVREELGHLRRRQRRALASETVLALLEELGRGRVKRDHEVLTRPVPGLLDRLDDQVERLLVGRQARRIAALITDIGVQTTAGERLLQGVEDLGSPAQPLPERLGAPTGITMNSCMSTLEPSACLPPLRMFIIGTGSVRALGPPR